MGAEGAPPAAVPPGVISTKPLVAALPPFPSAPPPVGAAPSSPAIAAAPATPPKLTAAVAPSLKALAPTAAAVPNLPATTAVKLTAPSAPGAELPENSSAFKAGIWIVSTLVVVVVGVVAFFAYRFLQPKVEPAAALVAPKPVVPPAKLAPTAVATEPPAHQVVVADPQSLPGKMVGKARDIAAAHDQSGQVNGVGEVLGDPPETPLPARSTPPTHAASTPASQRDIPLDASTPPQEAMVDKPAAPPASIAFRTFVANLRVSGVFQGEPGRALLNGRTIRIGEVADNTLGIRLSRLDYDRKILYFEDNSGATMQRRY